MYIYIYVPLNHHFSQFSETHFHPKKTPGTAVLNGIAGEKVLDRQFLDIAALLPMG